MDVRSSRDALLGIALFVVSIVGVSYANAQSMSAPGKNEDFAQQGRANERSGETWSQRILPLPDRSLNSADQQRALLDEISRWSGLRSQMEQLKQLAEKNPEVLRSFQGALSDDQQKAIEEIFGAPPSDRTFPIPEGKVGRDGPFGSGTQSREESNADVRSQQPPPLPESAGESKPTSQADRFGSATEEDLFKDVPKFDEMDPFAPMDSPLSDDTPSTSMQTRQDATLGSNQSERDRQLRRRDRSQTEASSGVPGQGGGPQEAGLERSEEAPMATNPPSRSLPPETMEKLQRDVRSGNVRRALQEILAEARKESAQKRSRESSVVNRESDTDASSTADLPTTTLPAMPQSPNLPKSIEGGELSSASADDAPAGLSRLPSMQPQAERSPGSSRRAQGMNSGNQVAGDEGSFGGGNQTSTGAQPASQENNGWGAAFNRFAQRLYDAVATAPEAPETTAETVPSEDVEATSDEPLGSLQWPTFLLQSLLGLGTVGLVIWAVLRSRRRAEQREFAAQQSLRWQVASGSDLVTAFHQIALGGPSFGVDSKQSAFAFKQRDSEHEHVAKPWWNHRRAANLIMQRQPANVDLVKDLIGLYERVRYSPSGDDLTAGEVEQVRQALEKLRGC